MKEKLMKKRYGVPALALILVIALSGAAIAGFTYVYKVTTTVQEPKSEQKSVSFSVPAGGSFSKTAKLDVALPGSYDLKYTLKGDTVGILKHETAKLVLDKDKDWSTTGDQISKTLGSVGDTATFSSISDKDFQVKITISADAKDHVLATASWSSGTQDKDPGVKGKPTLSVKLEPTKV